MNKKQLLWLALSTIPMMPIASFAMGDFGVYTMTFFGGLFATLWVTYPKDKP